MAISEIPTFNPAETPRAFSKRRKIDPDIVAFLIDGEVLIDTKFKREGRGDFYITSDLDLKALRDDRLVDIIQPDPENRSTIVVGLRPRRRVVYMGRGESFKYKLRASDFDGYSAMVEIKSTHPVKLVEVPKDEFYVDFVKRFRQRKVTSSIG
ncbi:MAG TPA: hypothetical protein VKC89_02600 [Patescibacteria group bacterium]|nr:hypothetical protein [Patescibacteria group bacterium]